MKSTSHDQTGVQHMNMPNDFDILRIPIEGEERSNTGGEGEPSNSNG